MSGVTIAVASGKGGTGKTTVSVNLALALARRGHAAQYIDCDVEEPNGHLFLKPTIERREVVELAVPVIDEARCTACGACAEVCRFNALAVLKKAMVFPELCHGCGACFSICPVGAIAEKSRPVGEVETGTAGPIAFAQGRLRVGEPSASTTIRATRKARQPEAWAVLDAPPGTACSAVATLRDADYVLLVTEPTPFGLHDLTLAVELTRTLKRPLGIVLNRAGLGHDEAVRAYALKAEVPILAEIPDDRRVAEAYARGDLAMAELPGFREALDRLTGAVERALDFKNNKQES